MNLRRLRSGFVSTVLCVGFLTCAQPTQPPPAPPPTPRAALPRAEKSVRPGINAEYLQPKVDVQTWVERFEKEGREIYERRQEIVATVKVQPGWIVADIGAGTGLFTPMLAGATGPSGKVFAVDIVPDFLKHIEARLAQSGVTNVQTVLCTERSVELPTNSIHLAFICDVYHHFEFPKSSLASLHRALKDDGQLFLIEFKRIPGISSDWVMNHVRAGQAVFTVEIESAGFNQVEEIPLLKDNYVLRFKKVPNKATAP